MATPLTDVNFTKLSATVTDGVPLSSSGGLRRWNDVMLAHNNPGKATPKCSVHSSDSPGVSTCQNGFDTYLHSVYSNWPTKGQHWTGGDVHGCRVVQGRMRGMNPHTGIQQLFCK